jgi:hypothetical protein
MLSETYFTKSTTYGNYGIVDGIVKSENLFFLVIQEVNTPPNNRVGVVGEGLREIITMIQMFG